MFSRWGGVGLWLLSSNETSFFEGVHCYQHRHFLTMYLSVSEIFTPPSLFVIHCPFLCQKLLGNSLLKLEGDDRLDINCTLPLTDQVGSHSKLVPVLPPAESTTKLCRFEGETLHRTQRYKNIPGKATYGRCKY